MSGGSAFPVSPTTAPVSPVSMLMRRHASDPDRCSGEGSSLRYSTSVRRFQTCGTPLVSVTQPHICHRLKEQLTVNAISAIR
eukprot:2118785-Pleurochrysis_carterae.AAC.1